MPSKSELKRLKFFSRMLESHPQALRWFLYWALPSCPLDRVFIDGEVESVKPSEIGIPHDYTRFQRYEVDVRAAIRAAFELGFIEQAMDCQQRLDRYENR